MHSEQTWYCYLQMYPELTLISIPRCTPCRLDIANSQWTPNRLDIAISRCIPSWPWLLPPDVPIVSTKVYLKIYFVCRCSQLNYPPIDWFVVTSVNRYSLVRIITVRCFRCTADTTVSNDVTSASCYLRVVIKWPSLKCVPEYFAHLLD